MTVRSQYAFRGFRAGCLLATAGVFASSLQSVAGDDSFHARSTLSSQVTPQTSSLDATIASMVQRGLLPDVRPAHTASRTSTPVLIVPTAPTVATPAPDLASSLPALSEPITPTPSLPSAAAPTPALQPQRVASNAPATTTAPGKWRPAGSTSLNSQQAAAEAFSEPQFPTLPETNAPALAPTNAGPSLPLSSAAPSLPIETNAAPVEAASEGIRLHAPIKLDGPSIAPSPAGDDDQADEEMAPIDEFSETPAPATDAPGDASEPEFTGAAVADALAPAARPLSEAPKPSSTTGNIALGEPDRYARPSDRVENPTDPKSFEEADEPTASPQQQRALPPLTKSQILLRNKVRQVLKHYYNRPLVATERSPWEVMHGMLGFEVHSRVLQGGPKSQPITAVGWLCFNQACENRTLMYLNEDGDLRVKVGPALQGHHGQLLALFGPGPRPLGLSAEGRRERLYRGRPDRGREAHLLSEDGAHLQADRPAALPQHRRYLGERPRDAVGFPQTDR